MGAILLGLSLGMVVHRPLLNDALLAVDLWGCCLTLMISGMVLWAHRKTTTNETEIAMQRLQAKTAAGLAVLAVAVIYILVGIAAPVPR